MRRSRRKPRYQSDPLPSRTDSESPPLPENQHSSHPVSSESHSISTNTERRLPTAFPLTPVSAGHHGPTSPTRIIERYPSSYHREPRQALNATSRHKMSRPSCPSPHDSSSDTPSLYSPHPNGPSSSSSAVMPHRIDTFQTQTKSRSFHGDNGGTYYSSRHTLTHSPALSSDQSYASSPTPPNLPSIAPAHHGHISHGYTSGQSLKYSQQSSHGQFQHQYYGQETVSPPELFSPSNSYMTSHSTAGYNVHAQQHPSAHRSVPSSMPPHYVPAPVYHHTQLMAQPIFTDDAATKLSDRVRRRCFNCCTTDTSTWRRSSLHPGKVLCNKCGLFERTHARPRPDQFPHKRGPLTTPTFQSKSPPHPTRSPPHPHDRALPPPQQHPQQQQPQSYSPPHTLPPHAQHPSLASTYAQPNQLPQIQEWLRGPGRNRAPYSPTHSSAPSSAHASSGTPRSPPKTTFQTSAGQPAHPAHSLTPSPPPQPSSNSRPSTSQSYAS